MRAALSPPDQIVLAAHALLNPIIV